MRIGFAAIALWTAMWLFALVALALTPAHTLNRAADPGANLTIAAQQRPSPLLRDLAPPHVPDFPEVEERGARPAYAFY
jgi:hypothetical protein